MGSSIYTKTGDRGQTSLVDGSRVPKDSLRVSAYGTIDEANSWVGVARTTNPDELLQDTLEFIQHRFFNCSSILATPPDSGISTPTITEEDIGFLERAIDLFEERTGPLRSFVIPGGTQCAAFLHVARTVCRRAERLMVSLDSHEGVDRLALKLVNRASDCMFAASRYANSCEGRRDPAWDVNHPIPKLESTE